MQSEGILIDRLDRRIAVVALARTWRGKPVGVVDADAEAELLDEITDLVESPVGILGRFDPKYLDLPDDVLTTVMRKHHAICPFAPPPASCCLLHHHGGRAVITRFRDLAVGAPEEGALLTGAPTSASIEPDGTARPPW